jgi:hypothetical protein
MWDGLSSPSAARQGGCRGRGRVREPVPHCSPNSSQALRIELAILIGVLGAFRPAYTTIAWLSWVPNFLWATLYVRATRAGETPVVSRYLLADTPNVRPLQ